MPVRLGSAFDMGCVNADNELSLGIIWKIKLDLLALVRVWRIEPGAISRLSSSRLPRASVRWRTVTKDSVDLTGKIRDDICRIAVGHQTAEASRQLHQFRRRSPGRGKNPAGLRRRRGNTECLDYELRRSQTPF